MNRKWYISTVPLTPGESTLVLERGVSTAKRAAALANSLRERGYKSEIWLILVENNHVTHCNKYNG